MARPLAEDRLARTLAVLSWLAVHHTARLDDLAERFQVSTKVLEKDLTSASLAEYAPGDPGQMVWVEIVDGEITATIPDRFREAPRLDRREALAVVAAGRAALAITPDQPALAGAVDKVEAALGVELVVEVERPPALDDFERAAAEGRRLRISYWSAWRDAFTDREVDPLRIEYADGEWYARCHCHRSNEERIFRLDRVEDWAPTGDTFTPPDDVDGVDFTPGADMVLARVWFPAQARWVTEYLPVEVVSEEPDGSLVADLPCVGDWWLARLLLRTGGRVREPAEWRTLGPDAARRVLERYE